MFRSIVGSSPLTRGKPDLALSHSIPERLIPAHAGKTATSRTCRMTRSAHPRSRGENRRRPSGSLAIGGSSPLTRGKLSVVVGQRGGGRLIPAHAGKTGRGVSSVMVSSAHPRSRGENPKGREETAVDIGSSPLTRGKLYRREGSQCVRRLIPAHAGKTRPPTGHTPS